MFLQRFAKTMNLKRAIDKNYKLIYEIELPRIGK